eukprot:1176157-Prorocentrum_minimum.AAC.3
MEALGASSMLPLFQAAAKTSDGAASRVCLMCRCSSSPMGLHGSSMKARPAKRSVKMATSAPGSDRGKG